MAARKKAKSRPKKKAQAKRRKAPARKRTVRRKAAKPRKKAVARRKPARKRARAVARKPRAARPPRAARVETLPGERIGVVTHYFSHLSVAVFRLDPGVTLRVGDRIHIKGHTTDFGQRVDSLQVEHQPVMEVGPADDFGLKVTDHAREHDIVYRVS